jgi:hypothetical protein
MVLMRGVNILNIEIEEEPKYINNWKMPVTAK